jgi:hypothetical protein
VFFGKRHQITLQSADMMALALDGESDGMDGASRE